MKTRRNNMAILRLLFAGIFFSSPFSVSAQDYIKEAVNTVSSLPGMAMC